MDEKGGIIVIDKPAGITSARVVQKVKKALMAEKAGHLGTLDPIATGVLCLAVNRGTKLVEFSQNGYKTYYAVIKLGEETDTLDAEGKIVRTAEINNVTEETVTAALEGLKGTISQIPPMYSALKKNGKPLYKLARQGKEVERQPRQVEIASLQLKRLNLPYLYLSVICSGGTYIRSLAAELGRLLGCGGHLLGLRRVASEPWNLNQSVILSDFDSKDPKSIWNEHALPFDHVLDFLPQVQIQKDDIELVRKGTRLITIDCEAGFDQSLTENDLVALKYNEALFAVAKRHNIEDSADKAKSGDIAFKIAKVVG